MTHVMLVVWEISRTNASQDAILSNGPSGALNFPKVTFLLIYLSKPAKLNQHSKPRFQSCWGGWIKILTGHGCLNVREACLRLLPTAQSPIVQHTNNHCSTQQQSFRPIPTWVPIFSLFLIMITIVTFFLVRHNDDQLYEFIHFMHVQRLPSWF